jgi:hypothetical protein
VPPPPPPPSQTSAPPRQRRQISHHRVESADIPPPPPPQQQQQQASAHKRDDSDVPPPPPLPPPSLTMKPKPTPAPALAPAPKPAPALPPPSAGRLLGTCGRCGGEVVEGDAVRAAGRVYHMAHFTCQGGCGRSLAGQHFYHHGELVMCRADFEAQAGRLCGRCGEPVASGVGTDSVVYHPKCLRCSVCGKSW